MKKRFVLITLFVTVLLPLAARAQQPIRVNCGGANYTDKKGQLWKADYGYNKGGSSTIPASVLGTADQTLFQTGRYNDGAGNGAGLIYSFDVPDGAYHVNLYFAETYSADWVTGGRVFNVKMQGNAVFSHLDVFAEAGADTALVKSADITVSAGKISIEFDAVTGSAKVDAIEILPGNTAPRLSLAFKYPDGSPVAGTLTYAVSSSLLSFSGKAALVNGQATCELLSNPSAIGVSMQFTVKISLSDSAGHLLWDMNLGMNPAEVNLAAVQDSSLTVVVQKM